MSDDANLAAVLCSAVVGLPWAILLAVAADRQRPGRGWVAVGAACLLLSYGAHAAHFAQEWFGVQGYLNRPRGWMIVLTFLPLQVTGWGLLTVGLRTVWRAAEFDPAPAPAEPVTVIVDP